MNYLEFIMHSMNGVLFMHKPNVAACKFQKEKKKKNSATVIYIYIFCPTILPPFSFFLFIDLRFKIYHQKYGKQFGELYWS